MKRAKTESPEQCNTEILSPEAKRHKILHHETVYDCNLLDLSDDVLLHIFKNLSAFDLMSLHLCCVRLHDLCCDRTLWKSIDLRAQHVPLEELKKYVKFMQPVTKVLAIRGNKRRNELPELHPNFLNTVSSKCEHLEEFILEDYCILQEKIQITNFPKSLHKFSLKGCHVVKDSARQDNRSYLWKIDVHMPNLTCLILTNCNWLNAHSFMAISKITKLKEVRMNSCYGLSDNVAYTSLACRYGLRSLEVLDLRDTFVGDSVVSCFSHTSTLSEIYLECPGSETVHHQPDQDFQRQEILFVQIPGVPQVVENDFNQIIINFLNHARRNQVSDRSVCSLGLASNEMLQNRNEVQLVEGGPRISTNPNLKKLVVRNYTQVTNHTLFNFVVNGPKLEYLDVTGTSVTKQGLEFFKLNRPNVTLISSFDEI